MNERLEETFGVPVEQELLDTSILESMRQPILETEETEQPHTPEPPRRTQQQETGKRIMDAARFLPSGPIKEVLALDLGTIQEEVTPTHYEIVIERASQALGPAQFENLVDELKASARTDEPGATMDKFRAQAGNSIMDAGELWEAVLVQAKQERYGDEKLREGIKFYYSMPLEEFERYLEHGKLERSDGQINPLASNLRFTEDTLEGDKWASGFAAAQDDKQADVTLVFDKDLIDQDDFIALGERPTVGMVDLREKCLGVVLGKENQQEALAALRDSELYMLPAFLKQGDDGGWDNNYYDVDYLRRYKQDFSERMIKKTELCKEVFTDVDYFAVGREVRKFSQKVPIESVIDLIDRNSRLQTEKERERADVEIVQIFSEALAITPTPEVIIYNDPNDGFTGMCEHRPMGEPSRMLVNRARIDGGNLRESFINLAHEMWHDHQMDLAERADDEELRKELSPEELKRAEFYSLNYQNLKRFEDDPVGYREQLAEVEARRFEIQMGKIFDQALTEQRKPISKLKRSMTGLRQNIISNDGKRIAGKKKPEVGGEV